MTINNNEILEEIRKDIENLSFEEAKTLVSNLWIQIFEVDKELDSLKGFGIINNDEFFNSIQKVRRNLWKRFVDNTLNLYEQFCINPLFGDTVSINAGTTIGITQTLIDSNPEAEKIALDHILSIPIYKKVKYQMLPSNAHETTLYKNLSELHESIRDFYAECADGEFMELFDPIINPKSNKRNIYEALKIQGLADCQWLMKKILDHSNTCINSDLEKEDKLRKIYYQKLLELINSPVPKELDFQELQEYKLLEKN